MANIMIVDDHSVIRVAVRMLLEAEGHTIVSEVGSGVEAISLVRSCLPDLLIIDLDIPKMDGLEVLKRLHVTCPTVKTMVFSAMPMERYINRCISVGALAFVEKSSDFNSLKNAVKAVLSGYTFFPIQHENVLPSREQEVINFDSLSSRELLVLKLLADGYRNKEIADQLIISEKTVSTYKVRVCKKMQTTSLLELADMAKRHGII